MMSSLTLDNEAYVELLRYGGMLLVKLVLMSPLTTVYRFVFKSFASEEDGNFLARDNPEMRDQMAKKNPHVERVRAAHMNDLENLVPFFIIAIFYVSTNPDPVTAGILFKIFMAFRFAHTVIYLAKIPQPCRVISFAVGFGINMYMGIYTLVQAWSTLI